MEFRTKREAEQAIAEKRECAKQHDGWAKDMDAGGATGIAKWHRRDARQLRAEAARIRALLPNLPEGV